MESIMKYEILNGHSAELLKKFPENSIDAIVTDPPYLIGFLGKSWDAADNFQLDVYQECLRVLKPGGHILAFSAARTYHHLAVTLEQAGFEIRDQIMWIYSSGFPKSQDIGKSIQRSMGVKEKKILAKTTGYTNKEGVKGKEKWMSPGNTTGDDYAKQQEQVVCTDPEAKAWAGWGTQLKPAHEPIALARKPIKLSIAKNCQQWGTGALNIDATRIPTDDVIICGAGNDNTFNKFNAENNVDGPGTGTKINKDVPKWTQAEGGRFPSNVLGDIPDYQKYFYCPKVGRRERHIGFPVAKGMYEIAREHGYTLAYDDPNDTSVGYMVDTQGNKVPDLVLQKLVEQHGGGNNHPTVKPVALMEYLIKLITPPGGTVLDPFNGSGSTGMAAVGLGYNYIGCELDPAYVAIAEKRIAAWLQQSDPLRASGLFE